MTPEENKRVIHKRIVRSFVRRDGRLTAGQAKALNDLWPLYGLDPHIPLCRAEQIPMVLEIGFGTGDSLVQMAKNDPEKVFVGIEVHRPGVGHLLKRISAEHIENIKIYCADAVEVLQQCIADESLHTVQIFFPDPWHKKRHHKRRLIQAPFLHLLARKLQPEGIVHIATDWQDYAEHCVAAFSTLEDSEPTALFRNLAPTPPYSPRPPQRPLTKFEQRGQRLGHDVWDLLYQKL
ncbi:MAG: tRNA (guanosine(46)-N7)-methyltransferase TrmB [Gammaproteobacteria bacterium]|nr:tRNA (guanosine(46)-N7)-methyltransferase TrmB [Gammaproteobacteria bacterium]MDH5802618.1 tRNA (guanosine(46)-N7)-methyltransferase TrmB [Gammaproteobacteria bacterium]